METVTITKAEYDKLKADSESLHRLEVYGVDNWMCYYTALTDADNLFCNGGA